MIIKMSDQLLRIKYLSGPVSWYHFRDNTREYILFGDSHDGKDNDCASKNFDCLDVDNNYSLEDNGIYDCATLTAYLSLLLRYNKENGIITDVFLEKPFMLKESKINLIPYSNQKFKSYSNDIYMTFNKCLRYDKSNCGYLPEVQFHNTDVRYIVSEDYDKKGQEYINANHLLPSIRDKLDEFRLKLKNKADKAELLQEMKSIYNLSKVISSTASYFYSSCMNEVDYKLVVDELIETYNDNKIKEKLIQSTKLTSLRDGKYLHKIAVQLRELRLLGKEAVVNKIKLWIMFNVSNKAILYRKEADELMDICNKILVKDVITNEDINIINGKMLYLMNADMVMYSYILDTYLIARMLKYDSDQVIIYIGDLHLRNLVPFFQHILKYNLVASSGPNTKSRCIENFQAFPQ
jgi:hypothetical protein